MSSEFDDGREQYRVAESSLRLNGLLLERCVRIRQQKPLLQRWGVKVISPKSIITLIFHERLSDSRPIYCPGAITA
jgi:hypothetical protein